MVDYYCDVTDRLSMLKKILVEATPEKILPTPSIPGFVSIPSAVLENLLKALY